VEPNDDFRVPNALAASSCGSLSGADAQDWYTWSIAGATPYALELETKGDAVVVMFKKVNGKYARVANTTMTSIAHTASGAGSYLVAVFTPGGAAQPYQLTLQK
jgi:hypothetical protein